MCYWKCVTAQTEEADTDKDMGKEWKTEERQEKQHVVTVIVPITFDSESLSCPVNKEKANQYCHSQLQIKLCLLLLPPCSFLGYSVCRNCDKRISIDCWWDQRINKWNVFFSSLPLFVFSSKMGKEWSNGAKHIKRQQSSTNTIKPWSRNYFQRRGSIAVQMFLQFRVSCHKPLNALKQYCAVKVFNRKVVPVLYVGPDMGPNWGKKKMWGKKQTQSKYWKYPPRFMPDIRLYWQCGFNRLSLFLTASAEM